MRRPVVAMLAGALPLAFAVTTASAGTADRPNTTAGAAHGSVSPNGKWIREALSSNNDKDWFRFHVASGFDHALVTLGHLAGNYSLTVVDSNGTTVGRSDRAGRQFEELYLPVSVGDYLVKVAADSGANASVDYVLKFRPLLPTVQIVEKKELGDIDGFDIVGELLNNTPHWVKLFDLHVTWLDKNGKAVGTVDEGIRPGPIAPHTRAEFTVKHKREPNGDVPATATSYRIRVDAGNTTDRTPSGLLVKPTATGVRGTQRTYEGSLTNNSSVTMTQIYPTVIEYDARGRANAIGYDLIRSLAPGKSTTYKVFVGNNHTPAPNAVRIYASITGS